MILNFPIDSDVKDLINAILGRCKDVIIPITF